VLCIVAEARSAAVAPTRTATSRSRRRPPRPQRLIDM